MKAKEGNQEENLDQRRPFLCMVNAANFDSQSTVRTAETLSLLFRLKASAMQSASSQGNVMLNTFGQESNTTAIKENETYKVVENVKETNYMR